MNIHEYQAKELLRQFMVATPDGQGGRDAAEAAAITQEFGGQSVIKAQIHAGGRGKGGGVKFARTPERGRRTVHADARHDPGHQADRARGPQGRAPCSSPEPVDIARELYLSLLVDRGTGRVAVLASTEGGRGDRGGGRQDPGEDRAR